MSKEEERKRQEKLARERIEAARQGRSQGRQLDDDSLVVVDTEDPASLQEAIARDLDRRHRKEMEFFMQVGISESYHRVSTVREKFWEKNVFQGQRIVREFRHQSGNLALSAKSQGILKRQVCEFENISRIKAKAFSSCLEFRIVEYAVRKLCFQ